MTLAPFSKRSKPLVAIFTFGSRPFTAVSVSLFVNEVTLAKCGTAPKELPPEKRQGVNPPAAVPPRLVESAEKSGVALTQAAWAALDDDERYALIKLGVEKESHKLKAALDEFVK